MKQAVDLVNEKNLLSNGLDNVVIKKHIMGIMGGRSLDVTGFEEPIIKAGHVIIKTQEGEYAPMPVVPETTTSGEGDEQVVEETGNKVYGELPEGATYVGVLKVSILTKKPFAAITTWGIVNEACVPFPIDDIKEAFLEACPHIEFTQDEAFEK